MAFYTLGCKVNQYETAAMEQLFVSRGFSVVPHDGQAEVFVLNSCTVTAQGDRKSRQLLRRFRRRCPGAVIALCGCYPQAFPEQAAQIAEADVVVGSKDRARLVELVRERLCGGAARTVCISPHRREDGFEPLRVERFSARTRATLKIQDGCERFCAYCIIPFARGPVRSKPPGDLRGELAGLSAAGYREVVLVGINLSSYGQDLGLRLLDAVRAACGTPGIERVRLGSLEPELLTGEDIRAMAALPGLCPQFHLSLQSGCDDTLRRMRRQYDTAQYRAIARELRAAFPGCAITTDIMVGFPGESDGEFAASLRFAREIAFAKAHVFAYSRRPGTAAARMPGQVDEREKALRARRMAEATDTDRRAFFAAQVGERASVLLETRLPDGRWQGHLPNYTPVVLYAPGAAPGDILQARILSCGDEHCEGEPAPERIDNSLEIPNTQNWS